MLTFSAWHRLWILRKISTFAIKMLVFSDGHHVNIKIQNTHRMLKNCKELITMFKKKKTQTNLITICDFTKLLFIISQQKNHNFATKTQNDYSQFHKKNHNFSTKTDETTEPIKPPNHQKQSKKKKNLCQT